DPATRFGSDTYQRVPEPVKIHAPTGAPVYALNGDCPRLLPPMLHGADMIVFGARIPAGATEDAVWFMVNVLGGTLQSAADHRMSYCTIDYPNPLENKRI